LKALDGVDVPAAKVYDVADIVSDAQYLARDMIEQHQLPDGKPVKLPGIVPKLSDTPGATQWIGPKLGEHTGEILRGLGYDTAAQQALKARGVT
jgi:formyl-CoA transferase